MSFILKKEGVVIQTLGYWNPRVFSKLTQTSFPIEVTKDYVWQDGDYWLGWEEDLTITPTTLTDEEIEAEQKAEEEQIRIDAYRNESDPLFFKYQRGEIEKQEWLDKIAEIKSRYSREKVSELTIT